MLAQKSELSLSLSLLFLSLSLSLCLRWEGNPRTFVKLAFQLAFQLAAENDPGRPATYSEGCRASRAGR